MSLNKKMTTALVSLALFAAGAANAAVTIISNTSSITVFEDQATFAAAAGVVGIDSYDDLPFGPQGVTLDRVAGAYSYTASAANEVYGSGTPNPYLSTSESSDPILFSGFSAAVRGVGGHFFSSDDAGDPVIRTGVTLSIIDATGILVVEVVGGFDAFTGFVSTAAIQAVSLQSGGSAVFASADDFAVAAPVPEPSTVAMLLAGSAVLPFAVRRRMKKN